MLASGVGALTYGFLFLTFVLWFTALIVPSWFVFSMKFKNSKLLYMDEARIGLLYNNECRQGSCWHVSHSDDNRPYSSLMPAMLELQIESISALLFCSVSFVLLLFPKKGSTKFSSTRLVFATVLILPIAYILELILIIRATLAYKEMSIAFKRLEVIIPLKVEMKFPYCLLLSGIGTIFAFLGWVSCIFLHRKFRESHNRNKDQVTATSNNKCGCLSYVFK